MEARSAKETIVNRADIEQQIRTREQFHVQQQLDTAAAAEKVVGELADVLDGCDAHEDLQTVQMSIQRLTASLERAARGLAHLYDGGGDSELGGLDHKVKSALDLASDQFAAAAHFLAIAADNERLIEARFRASRDGFTR